MHKKRTEKESLKHENFHWVLNHYRHVYDGPMQVFENHSKQCLYYILKYDIKLNGVMKNLNAIARIIFN